MGHIVGWNGTPQERLERHLVRRSNGCLEWTGRSKNVASGRGLISVNGKLVQTHRLAWELTHGPIPAGMCVLHHCDNPPCCETEPSEEYPEGHLFLGTNGDNSADMVAKGRHSEQQVTHCPADHEYTEENTYYDPNGWRKCRECNRSSCAKRNKRSGY